MWILGVTGWGLVLKSQYRAVWTGVRVAPLWPSPLQSVASWFWCILDLCCLPCDLMQIIIYRGRGIFGSKQARVSWSGLHMGLTVFVSWLCPGGRMVWDGEGPWAPLWVPCPPLRSRPCRPGESTKVGCPLQRPSSFCFYENNNFWKWACGLFHFWHQFISLPTFLLTLPPQILFFFFFTPIFYFVLGYSRFYNVVIVSGEQGKGRSHTYTCIHSPPNSLPSSLPRNTEQSSLCRMVDPLVVTHFKYSRVYMTFQSP